MRRAKLPREDIQICVVAGLAACIIAANEVTGGGLVGWAGSYAYWLTRIFIEAALFVAVLSSIEKYTADRLSGWLLYSAAVVVSLIPFALAITSFDLIIGLPELGFNDQSTQTVSRLPAFGKELIYLFDNHLALCALLLLPRLLSQVAPADESPIERMPENSHATGAGFFDTLTPPLSGNILRIEAQEHYVRIITSAESRMVLLRFTDAVRELPASAGMQVHRSHWVAFTEFKEFLRDGQNLKLKLKSDELIPVSRSHRQQVEAKFQQYSGVS